MLCNNSPLTLMQNYSLATFRFDLLDFVFLKEIHNYSVSGHIYLGLYVLGVKLHVIDEQVLIMKIYS